MMDIVLAVLLAAAIGAAFYLWRRCGRLEREARFAAGLGDAPSLLTRADGSTVAANAAWIETTGLAAGTNGAAVNDSASSKDVAGRLADPGDHDRLAQAALRGETGHARLRPPEAGAGPPGAGGTGGLVWVSPHPLDAQYGLWQVFDCAPADSDLGRLAALAGDDRAGFYAADAEGRLLCVNETLAVWLGRSAQVLTDGDTHLNDFIVDPAPEAESGGNGRIPEGELTFRAADGREFPAVVSSECLPNANGAGPAMRGFVRDMTPAPAADVPLADTEIAWKAPVGIAVLDLLGRVVDANPAFGAHVGEDEDELVGAFVKDLLADEDVPNFTAWFGGIVRKEAVEPLQVKLSGHDTGVELMAARSGGNSGAPGRVFLYAADVSEAMIDPKAIQAQKMELVGQLAGGVAHDFNNLLTAMIGFCDLLLLRHSPKDHSFADIMQIKQNANRAANLVRQLLLFARRAMLQPRVLDVTDGLAELSHLLRRLIGATIELDMVHGRDLWLVKVDHSQFEQIIINLAVNARDAMGDGGTLTIQTMNLPQGDPRIAEYEDLPDIDYSVIEVSDTGCGIPPEIQEKIYEPFFTTKEVGEGTGLGLSTVYGIVKQTGGHIHVSSREGEGTTFTIFLPRFESEEEIADLRAERGEVEPRRDLTGAGTILLVEDEDAVRLFGARALRNKGYEVIEAVNGENALEVLESAEHAIDLVVTDVVMPGLDGPGLIRRVRETHPDLKVIFISGYTEETFRQRLDADVEVHFLSKPFSLQQLAGKVKEVMLEEPC